MILATADTTVLAAFAVGFISFLSPCVLPLVPGYLSAISGISIAEMRAGEHRLSHVLTPAIVFCLSFTLMFVALGMSATGLGSTLRDHKQTLDTIAGLLIIAMGVFFVLTPFVPRLNKDWRPDALIARAGTGGPIIAGLAFAIAWTPCVGPTLASILAAASTADSVATGGVLLAFYSARPGRPVPADRGRVRQGDRAPSRWLRDHYLTVTFISGAILIVMGVLILSGELTRLNIEAQQFLESIGLDGIYNL